LQYTKIVFTKQIYFNNYLFGINGAELGRDKRVVEGMWAVWSLWWDLEDEMGVGILGFKIGMFNVLM